MKNEIIIARTAQAAESFLNAKCMNARYSVEILLIEFLILLYWISSAHEHYV